MIYDPACFTSDDEAKIVRVMVRARELSCGGVGLTYRLARAHMRDQTTLDGLLEVSDDAFSQKLRQVLTAD